MRRAPCTWVALVLAATIGCQGGRDTEDEPAEPQEEAKPTDEITIPIDLPANDRLRSWGIVRIVGTAGTTSAKAQLVSSAGESLATFDILFRGERNTAQIAGFHGEMTLDLTAAEGAEYSMNIAAGARTWSATIDTTEGDADLYKEVSDLGYVEGFSQILVAAAPGSPGRTARYNELWGGHLADGCWSVPNGPALNCALSLPLFVADLYTINWMWGVCVPLCYGTALAPPSAVGCMACVGATVAFAGLSLYQWQQMYPEQCRKACLNGCWGEYPPMPEFLCGTAGRHEAPPPGMSCAPGLVKCCGKYCEYPTMCETVSAQIGAPVGLGESCGTMNVVTDGPGFPSCSTVGCSQGWCDDPDRDGVGTCVETMPQPPSSTWQVDALQPVLSKTADGGFGSAVTVNCSDPRPFLEQCKASSLRNVKTTYSRCWLCGYWTCGDIWDANKDVPERQWCDMLANNCVAATSSSCQQNNICGSMGQTCCNTGTTVNECANGLVCTEINGQRKCDE